MLTDLQLFNGLSIVHGLQFEAVADFVDACRALRLPAGATVDPHAHPGLLFVRGGELEEVVGTGPGAWVLRTFRRDSHAGASLLLELPGDRIEQLRARLPTTALYFPRDAYVALATRGHPLVQHLELEILQGQALELASRHGALARLSAGAPLPVGPSGLAPLWRGLLRGMGLVETQSPVSSELAPGIRRRLGLHRTAVEELVERLGRRVEVWDYTRGEPLPVADRRAGAAFVVQRGQVGRYALAADGSGGVLLEVLGSGELGGFTAAVADVPDETRYVAQEAGRALLLPTAELSGALRAPTPAGERVRRTLLEAQSLRLETARRNLMAIAHTAALAARRPRQAQAS